jgi:hypothetical protein
MTAETDDAPRRTLDKQEAIRHLIHTAIRLIAKMENPFAVHVLVHSADKLLIDMAKNRGRKLCADWETYIKPEYHKDFFRQHRAAYNYFKHASKDVDDDLPVRDIMKLNVMTLFICVVNYNELFGEVTNHMTLLMAFVMALLPEIIRPTTMNDVELLKGIRDFEGMTPNEFFTAFANNLNVLPNYAREVSEDLEDIVDFYRLSFVELRDRPARPGCATSRASRDSRDCRPPGRTSAAADPSPLCHRSHPTPVLAVNEGRGHAEAIAPVDRVRRCNSRG